MLESAQSVQRTYLRLTLLSTLSACVNEPIPSDQRATVLSFDSLMGSAGGVVTQPALGRAADVWSYSTSYIIGAAVQAAAVPFFFASRAEGAESDPITHG